MGVVSLEKKLNESFDIILMSTPSSGFKWLLKELPAAMILIDSKVLLDDKGQNVGNQSTQLFTLKGTMPGEFVAKFVLCRPWNDVSINEIIYNIVIY